MIDLVFDERSAPPDIASVLGRSLDPDRKDIFEVHVRKAWAHGPEPRCDFKPHPSITHRGVWFLSLWRRSVMGRTLSEIKADDNEIVRFSSSMALMLRELFSSDSFPAGGWAVIAAPKRRHKARNFASLTAEALAEDLGVPFFEDAVTARSRGRIDAVFDLRILPPQPNLLVFDDIVTTGSTLCAMRDCLAGAGKNILFCAGINNKA